MGDAILRQDDGRMIKKGCGKCSGTPLTVEKISLPAGLEPGTA